MKWKAYDMLAPQPEDIVRYKPTSIVGMIEDIKICECDFVHVRVRWGTPTGTALSWEDLSDLEVWR